MEMQYIWEKENGRNDYIYEPWTDTYLDSSYFLCMYNISDTT